MSKYELREIDSYDYHGLSYSDIYKNALIETYCRICGRLISKANGTVQSHEINDNLPKTFDNLQIVTRTDFCNECISGLRKILYPGKEKLLILPEQTVNLLNDFHAKMLYYKKVGKLNDYNEIVIKQQTHDEILRTTGCTNMEEFIEMYNFYFNNDVKLKIITTLK